MLVTLLDAAHELHPFPSIRQVFWFFIVMGKAEPQHYFWIELAADGKLRAVRITGHGIDLCAVISLLAAVDMTLDDGALYGLLRSTWLFPPEFSLRTLSTCAIIPTSDYFRKAHFAKPTSIQAVVDSAIQKCRPPNCREFPSATVVYGRLQGFHCTEVSNDEAPVSRSLIVRKELLSGALDFANNLNTGVFQFLELARLPFDLQYYNDVVSWPAVVRRNRTQAVAKYPWLAPIFRVGGAPENPRFCQMDDIVESIDEGRSFERQLALRLGVSGHTLKCVADLRERKEVCDYFPEILHLFEAMKPDFRPRNMFDLLRALPALLWCKSWAITEQALLKDIFADGILGARNKYQRWCPGHNPYDPSGDFAGYIRSTNRDRFLTANPDAMYGQIFKEQWRIHGGFKGFAQASEAWHQRQITGDFIDRSLKWSPILTKGDRVEIGEGMVACELTTAIALLAEGKAMRHCIASRAVDCHAGDSYVFSLRNQLGARSSTLQLIREAGRLRIREHRGFANAAPPSRAKEGAENLIHVLSKGFVANSLF